MLRGNWHRVDVIVFFFVAIGRSVRSTVEISIVKRHFVMVQDAVIRIHDVVSAGQKSSSEIEEIAKYGVYGVVSTRSVWNRSIAIGTLLSS